MGIHTWSGASRRGRRMSLELPFNGAMPLMLQTPEFLQRHSDFFHPYPPAHLIGRMQHSMGLDNHHKIDPQVLNLASKYVNSNGLKASTEERGRDYSNPPSPADSDKQMTPINSGDDLDSPNQNGNRSSSPSRAGSVDLSPRMWKLHYESKTVNRDAETKNEDQTKAVEEITA